MPETALTTQEAQAVAVPRPEMGFELTTIPEAYKLAQSLSKSALIPTALRGKPEDILVVLMSGRELGIPPMQSLRHLHCIEGRMSMSAQLILARVRRSPLCEYFTVLESTKTGAKCVTKRKGSVQEESADFTMDEAVAMNLAGRDNWKKQPRTMLMWRAVTRLCRMVYPDLIEGLYSDDEADDIQRPSNAAMMDAVPSRPRTLTDLTQRLQSDPPLDVEPEDVDEPEGASDPDPTPEPTPEPKPEPKAKAKPAAPVVW